MKYPIHFLRDFPRRDRIVGLFFRSNQQNIALKFSSRFGKDQNYFTKHKSNL